MLCLSILREREREREREERERERGERERESTDDLFSIERVERLYVFYNEYRQALFF